MPEVRGTAFALFSLADDLGKGFGPFLVVLIIQGCHGNRRLAFNIVVYFWLFCGLLLLTLVYTVQQDEDKVQHQVTQALYRHNNILGKGREHHNAKDEVTTIDEEESKEASLSSSSAVMKTKLLSNQSSSSSSSSSSWWIMRFFHHTSFSPSPSTSSSSNTRNNEIDMNNTHTNVF